MWGEFCETYSPNAEKDFEPNKISKSLIKQLIFDVAMELLHEARGLSNGELAHRLLDIVEAMDKVDKDA